MALIRIGAGQGVGYSSAMALCGGPAFLAFARTVNRNAGRVLCRPGENIGRMLS